MNLEDIAKEWEVASRVAEFGPEDFYELATFYMPKLLAIAKSNKRHLENWDLVRKECKCTSFLITEEQLKEHSSMLDPKYKYSDALSIAEALEELEKE